MATNGLLQCRQSERGDVGGAEWRGCAGEVPVICPDHLLKTGELRAEPVAAKRHLAQKQTVELGSVRDQTGQSAPSF